ncbi:MAG: cobalamin-independent methionine synthase II family protein [Hyphomicrobiaceae bacterium]|nr:cobalamin-independent methionine synthase II family protein [Hyphomicrobiaceae bacterium]
MATDRILTTHVGSLPRSEMVSDVVEAEDTGSPVSDELFDAVISEAIDVEVARQKSLGLDIVSDGEFSKLTYASYIQHRLTGFSGDSPLVTPADLDEFPGAAAEARRRRAQKFHRPMCTGPVAIRTRAPLDADIRRMKAAVEKHKPGGAFLTAASPGLIAIFHPNRHYPTHMAYLEALANAMRVEYQAIVAAGFDLQIDCPDLAMGRHTIFKHASDAAFLNHAHEQVEALNHALAGLPPERLRMYVSWGNYEGPHTHDIALDKILPIILKGRPRQILIEAATPTHQHDWRVFERIRLPDDKLLAPGVIDVTNNYVEHPEVVADRLERFASVVGRERLIASTDSGFAAFAGDRMVDPKVAFAKLQSLVKGAAIASGRLWGSQNR